MRNLLSHGVKFNVKWCSNSCRGASADVLLERGQIPSPVKGASAEVLLGRGQIPSPYGEVCTVRGLHGEENGVKFNANWGEILCQMVYI